MMSTYIKKFRKFPSKKSELNQQVNERIRDGYRVTRIIRMRALQCCFEKRVHIVYVHRINQRLNRKITCKRPLLIAINR